MENRLTTVSFMRTNARGWRRESWRLIKIVNFEGEWDLGSPSELAVVVNLWKSYHSQLWWAIPVPTITNFQCSEIQVKISKDWGSTHKWKLSSCLSSQFGCDMLMKKTKNFLFFKWKINFSFCLTNKEKLQQILLIEKEIQNTQFNIHITAILMSLVGNNWKICFVLIKKKKEK